MADALDLITQLDEVEVIEHDRYLECQVAGRTFGYVWPRTSTVGLKQTLTEQLHLVAERPEVFEVQFTSGGFGWVVVDLEGIDRTELSELVFEAWRLSATEELVTARADHLPT